MCDCIERENQKLAAFNKRLNVERIAQVERVYITTHNPYLDGRRAKRHRTIARFCPFCGEKYPEAKR